MKKIIFLHFGFASSDFCTNFASQSGMKRTEMQNAELAQW